MAVHAGVLSIVSASVALLGGGRDVIDLSITLGVEKFYLCHTATLRTNKCILKTLEDP